MTIESNAVIELRQAIQIFAGSSRFQILKNLQVGRLMPEGCGDLGSIKEMTFETLVELGSERIKKSMQLTALQQASLVELLRALASEQDIFEPGAESDNDEESSREPRGAEPINQETDSNVASENILSSVQLELNLRHCLQELRDHPDYSAIRRTSLSTYWDASWTPAPFEEALTIDQLGAMDLSALFKKKMMNEQRISHMVMALERALASLRSPTRGSMPLLSQTSSAAPRVTSGGVPLSWTRLEKELPTIEGGMIELIVRVASDPQNDTTRAVILNVMNTLAPEEFIDTVMSREIPVILRQRLARLASELVGPVTCNLIRAALTGPGIHESLVSEVLSSIVEDSGAVGKLLSVLVIRGLGAKRITYRGVSLEGFWTLHPGLLEAIASKLKNPAIEELVDPKLLQFLRDQDGQEKRGKGRPQSRVTNRKKGK